ncbi:acyltransferase [Rheinheimera faecalis]|jgi:maltose O-acetyltransferase
MFIHKLSNFMYRILDYRFYKKKYKIGDGFRFNGYGTRIVGDGVFQSGDDSYISYNSHIVLANGTKLVIGNNVSISHYVRIYTSSFCTMSKIMSSNYIEVKGDVFIGNNVLIGSGCFICPNVKIGDNVVVGANSVVSRDLPSGGVYAGVPARLIRNYSTD